MLRPFFDWLQTLTYSQEFRLSTWMFPSVDAIHLVALAVFAGSLLIVDLRLLGFGLKERPVDVVSREAQPWLVGSFVCLLLTGASMIAGNGDKYYYSDFFWEKMTVLVVAFVFTFTLRRRIALAGETGVRPIWRKLTAVASLAMWLFVAVWGRLIGLA